MLEEQLRQKFPLLADDTPSKRRRLDTTDPHPFTIRAALKGCDVLRLHQCISAEPVRVPVFVCGCLLLLKLFGLRTRTA